MADFQIPDKTLLTAVDRAADSWLIYDNSATALKRTTINYALDLTSHPVGVDDTQTLTAKTLTSPTINGATLSGTLTGTYTIGGTPTFPSSVVTLTGSQTLTNKVLTSPTINNATVANPTLTVDTVSEHTTANGVTIDSLNIKDGKLNTNDSVVTANITNKAVTEEKISDGWVHGSDGWIDSTQTWTYVSATSFKITGTDVTAQFPVGTKIKLTQTTAKYFYVTAATFSTDTTVTVTGGSDYTLANAAITSPMYSYMASPQGHPGWFNYAPTLTNVTTTSGTLVGRFTMIGKTVKSRGSFTLGASSSISGTVTATLPVTAKLDYIVVVDTFGTGFALNSGTSLHPLIIKCTNAADFTLAVITTSAGTNPVFNEIGSGRSVSNTVPFAFGTSDAFSWNIEYEAA